MPIFCDIPDVLNKEFDFYAEMHVQLSLALQYQQKIKAALSRIVNPGEIRFFKKKVKYKRKKDSEPHVYEYNCHHLRYSETTVDQEGNIKVYHRTRFIKKGEYEEILHDASLCEYLSLQLNIVNSIIDAAKKMLLGSFYHHPDDIPDFEEEACRININIDEVAEHRQWHFSNRVIRDPAKYNCIDENNLSFMSRGELLLHNAFRSCGLLPKYEVLYRDNKSGKCYYPDFSCKINGKTYYFEYFGMMRDPTYFSDCCAKIKSYIQHGIVPGHNFVAFFSGESSGIHMKPVFDVLKSLGCGKSLLRKKSKDDIPSGLIMLDNSYHNWQFPADLLSMITTYAKKLVPRGHRLKSSEKNR